MENENLPPPVSKAIGDLSDRMEAIANESTQRVDILLSGYKTILDLINSHSPINKKQISDIIGNTMQTLYTNIKTTP